MSDTKFSDLPDAGTLTGEELVALVQQVNEQNTSLKVTLAILKKFFGDVTVVDVGVNLNTLTEPGLYILQGAETMQESYNLNYPSGFNPGGRVMMLVSRETDNWAMIVQTYFYAKLTTNPLPYARGKSGGSTWSSWTQPVSGTEFSSKGLMQLSMAQSGLDLSIVGNNSTSNIYPFKTPVSDGSGPNILTAPSNKPGMHFSLRDPSSKPIIGAYKGNAVIFDQDGRVFNNVDTTQVTDPDNPKGVNWRELITVEMNSRKAISVPKEGQSDQMLDALKTIIQVMRDNHMILPGNATVTDVVIFPHAPEVTNVVSGQTSAMDVYTLPWFGDLVVYARSVDPSIATVPASIEILDFAQDDSLTPGVMTKYGYSTIEVTGVTAGSTAIEFSNDSAFTTVLATMAVGVTDPAG